MRNFSDKFVEEIKKHILSSMVFPPENRAVYEIMWKNIVQRGKTHDSMAHAQCMLDN
jgi:hypothetical protein